MGIRSSADTGVGHAERRAQKDARVERRRTGTETREDQLRRRSKALLGLIFFVGLTAGHALLDGSDWIGWILSAVTFLVLLSWLAVARELKRERTRSSVDADALGEVSDDDISRLLRLCLKHRLALLGADCQVVWSSAEWPRTGRREDVLERAVRCRRCRVRNAEFLAARPAGTGDAAPGSHGVVLNPTTAAWSPATVSGPMRERPRLGATAEAVIYIACVFVTLVGAATLLARNESTGTTGGTPIGTAVGVPTAGTTVDAPTVAAGPVGEFILVRDLERGDCVYNMAGAATGVATRVRCAASHADEVFATFELARGPWPGDESAGGLSDLGCEARFGRYVGSSLLATNLDTVDYPPAKESWNVDRKVICVLETGGYSTGSLRGSAD